MSRCLYIFLEVHGWTYLNWDAFPSYVFICHGSQFCALNLNCSRQGEFKEEDFVNTRKAASLSGWCLNLYICHAHLSLSTNVLIVLCKLKATPFITSLNSFGHLKNVHIIVQCFIRRIATALCCEVLIDINLMHVCFSSNYTNEYWALRRITNLYCCRLNINAIICYIADAKGANFVDGRGNTGSEETVWGLHSGKH